MGRDGDGDVGRWGYEGVFTAGKRKGEGLGTEN